MKTKIMFVIPGNIGDRILDDLNIEYTVREDRLDQFEFERQAFEKLTFCQVNLSKIKQTEMDELIDEIKRDWPDAAYVAYPHERALCFDHYAAENSWFYTKADEPRYLHHAFDPQGETVSIGYFLAAMTDFGMEPVPMNMDIDGPFDDEISLLGNYRSALSTLANLPRVHFEQQRENLPALFEALSDIRRGFSTDAQNAPPVSALAEWLIRRGYAVERAPHAWPEMDLLRLAHPEITGGEAFIINCRPRKQDDRPEILLCQRLLASEKDQNNARQRVLAVCHDETPDQPMRVNEQVCDLDTLEAVSALARH